MTDHPGATMRRKPLLMHLSLAASALADPQFAKHRRLDDDFWTGPDGIETRAEMRTVIEGIRRYQLHEFSRGPILRPVVWSDGNTRLLHYRCDDAKAAILVIPSMINGPEVMDLLPGRSFLEWMAANHLDVYLLDWGELTGDPELNTLDNALGMRVRNALNWLRPRLRQPLLGLGYCMGGLLLAAAEKLYPDAFDGLCFIATPWDFAAEGAGNFPAAVCNWAKDGLSQITHLDYMPAEWLQMIFASVDPALIARKFSAFAAMNPDSDEARLFVAVEDWVNGGSDLPSAVVRHCVANWYQGNRALDADWSVCGKKIDPALFSKPAFIVIPGRDRIVPPSSARALTATLSDRTVIEPDCGHISMMIGRQAETQVWQPLAEWIKQRFGRSRA